MWSDIKEVEKWTRRRDLVKLVSRNNTPRYMWFIAYDNKRKQSFVGSQVFENTWKRTSSQHLQHEILFHNSKLCCTLSCIKWLRCWQRQKYQRKSALTQENQIYSRLTLGSCTICRECIEVGCCKRVSQAHQGQAKRKEKRVDNSLQSWFKIQMTLEKWRHSQTSTQWSEIQWGQMEVSPEDKEKCLRR